MVVEILRDEFARERERGEGRPLRLIATNVEEIVRAVHF